MESSRGTCYTIGICGASCSGKTTVCRKIMEKMTTLFGTNSITIISQDSFYYGGNEDTNYDIPQALDFESLGNLIEELKKGNPVECPEYDFATHSRKKTTKTIQPTKIIIVEGILIFYDEKIKSLCNTRIYISSLPELRYDRRINRDVKERERKVEEVKKRYMRDVMPSFYQFIEPMKNFCHIELVNNEDGVFIGMEILLDHIKLSCIKCFEIKDISLLLQLLGTK